MIILQDQIGLMRQGAVDDYSTKQEKDLGLAARQLWQDGFDRMEAVVSFPTPCCRVAMGGKDTILAVDATNRDTLYKINPTLQRQFRLYIPFLGIARPQPQFPHSCVCERFIYSQDRSTYFLQQKIQTHRGNI